MRLVENSEVEERVCVAIWLTPTHFHVVANPRPKGQGTLSSTSSKCSRHVLHTKHRDEPFTEFINVAKITIRTVESGR